MAAAATTADVPIHVEIARAKINLALHVLGRRADGYHELDSIVAFADVGDRLTFETSGAFAISASGPFAHQLPPPADNIIHRAWMAVNAFAGSIAPVHAAIEKNLPVSSGIGGGSANAAATLRALLRINGLQPTAGEQRDMALSLGADVPVCLEQRAARMRGIGERLDPLPDFAPLHAVLVNPGVAVPTPEIFRAMRIEKDASYRTPVSAMDIKAWRNDMTEAAISLAPVIGDVLAGLQRQPGLITARMSGSGATCFGVFARAEFAQSAAEELRNRQTRWWTVETALGSIQSSDQ
jgi:4-diphosphocytidyl-2-C-methyl-D-erythritol kinase